MLRPVAVRMFESIAFVTMGLTIVLVMLVIVIVIAVPVAMRVRDTIEMFVRVQVESISIFVGAHRRLFRVFASAALSHRGSAKRQVAKQSLPYMRASCVQP